MELIYIYMYVQTRVKGQDSPELALERKREIEILQFITHLVQAYTIIFINILELVR